MFAPWLRRVLRVAKSPNRAELTRFILYFVPTLKFLFAFQNRMDEMNDRILDLVKERMAKGRAQYGHGLLEKSGYDWVQEALEEALDLSIYVAARLVEIKNTPPPSSH
jgi:hypothetical protein